MSRSVHTNPLVERLRTGDTGAFENLLTRYGSIVLQAIGQSAAGYADADDLHDLFQEACLRVWQELVIRKRQIDGTPLEAFLRRQAKDVAAEFCREKDRRQKLLAEHIGEARRNTLGTPQQPPDHESRSELERVKASFRLLPHLDQEVFLLHLEGMSYAEIAAHTGRSAAALRVKVSRVRGRLRNTRAT